MFGKIWVISRIFLLIGLFMVVFPRKAVMLLDRIFPASKGSGYNEMEEEKLGVGSKDASDFKIFGMVFIIVSILLDAIILVNVDF